MEWDEFKRQYLGDFAPGPSLGPQLTHFLEEWKGSCLCACDYGCNQWLARNAAKLFFIMKEFMFYPNAPNLIKLEEMAKEDSLVFASRLYKESRRASRRRA